MNDMSDLIKVGDVISSPKFSVGMYSTKFVEYADSDGTEVIECVADKKLPINVNQLNRTSAFKTEKKKDGFVRKRMVDVDVDASDETRGSARFLVVGASMTGGGICYQDHGGRGGDYPDGNQITAVRLDELGEVLEPKELIRFYQTGCFTGMIRDVEVHGRKDSVPVVNFE